MGKDNNSPEAVDMGKIKKETINEGLPTAVFAESEEDIEAIVNRFFPPRLPSLENSGSDEAHDAKKRPGNKYGETLKIDCLGYESSKAMLFDILYAIWKHVKKLTVIHEPYHVDPLYRDSYYNYFAGQHFEVSRFAHRLSFFYGDFTDQDAFSPEKATELNNNFIGTCVIHPTEAQTIGRVLIKPQYLLECGNVYRIRLTEYSITVRGIRLKLRAFPFQMQDMETTRCAEVTVLNIMDYYGNTYENYRVYLPGEVVNTEKQFTSDRTLPSRGITYATMSKLFTRFGFSPRLYSVKAMRREDGSTEQEWKEQKMHRLLHYYIESGIPVAVNVAKGKLPGHSLICVGYNDERKEELCGEDLGEGIQLFNSADYYHKYVVIDDNQVPYSVRDFDELSVHDGYKVENILVPLYKRMYLEATDAYDVVRYILKHENLGVRARYPQFMKKSTALVIRLFLASGRTFKKFRIENSVEQDAEYVHAYRRLYGEIPLPRFVWVAELFEKSKFEADDGKAFGEIVLDATASTKNDLKSIIMLNYPESVVTRWPTSPMSDLNSRYPDLILSPFTRFSGNLEGITAVETGLEENGGMETTSS